ncbi:substrate-binding domain-containing protein [Methylobacterium sp. BTF04]|uniref:sugar ABC transporter substrate-binding protein n=1 Tax=Methylobacterium sp. BTF04 TaxID=2708300 RepID=UPI0013CFB9A9|nr:substrate-binding domain-containing protein [Methylobacterium sp. BTF04]NEU14945.1 substrate-binding domain-containing protein [Methylobacterium sp. BTF04]
MKTPVLAGALLGVLLSFLCAAAQSGPFNPDTDPSRIRWTQLTPRLGPAPDVRGQRFGIVLKTQTNEYWRMMAVGYRRRAAADGIKLDIQAAQSEADQLRQLSIMQNMIGSRYKALLISPISAFNLQPAIDEAVAAKLPVVDMDGAVVDSVAHFVGPVNREMGVRVAQWFIRHYQSGGKVAVIEGQAGVFSTVQRSAGFRETLLATAKFEIVASVSGQWDRQQAFDVTKKIIQQTPDIIGFYCNNDTMALGSVEAVRSMGALDRIRVFGSDGTSAAYASITAGDLTGTVDIFPMMIGELGLDVASRLSANQSVPRVVETPQVLVTRDNIARYGTGEDTRRKSLTEDEIRVDIRYSR